MMSYLSRSDIEKIATQVFNDYIQILKLRVSVKSLLFYVFNHLLPDEYIRF